MADHYQVSVSAPSAEEAGRLATLVVERRLAACAQVSGPISSIYRWEGQVESASEWLCVLKTTSACLGPLCEAVAAAHSYETPEIIATAIEGGDPAYLEWLEEETDPTG